MNGNITQTNTARPDHEVIRPVIVGPIGGPMEPKNVVAFPASERTCDVNGIAVSTEGGTGATTR